MRLLNKLVMLSVVVTGLVLAAGCGERPKIAYYLVYPAAGQTVMSETEEARIKSLLDQVAAAYNMPKTKPSDVDIIRYYQPTPSLTIGFYAKRSGGKIAVHLRPLTRGFETREYYQQFHRTLVNTLSQNYPDRVATMWEP